jgi:hypothetical protein
MPFDFLKQLSKLNTDAENNPFSLDRLQEIRDEFKKAFDTRIDQLIIENEIVKKIKVPRRYIQLGKFKSHPIQIPINWRYMISTPFIYGMLFPAVTWHFFIEIYHQVCFRLYGIPLVDHKDYFIYDRKLLSWLNFWEKINCIYCSYVNNLIRYSSEIGGRTERYWCPIKYYRRITNAHSQYDKFVSETDPKKLRQQWDELRDFSDLKRN